MKNDVAHIPSTNKANICIDCKKAAGRCSWSAVDPETNKLLFKPVPGWTATKVLRQKNNPGDKDKTFETYRITACPLFEREEKRHSKDSWVTDEQFALILARWRRLGEIV